MGIGCYSLEKPKISFSGHKIEISKPLRGSKTTISLEFPFVKNCSSNSDLSQQIINQNISKSSKDAIDEHYFHSPIPELIAKPSFESKLIQRPILPNFPYSPLTSPHVSPEHKLHPLGIPENLYKKDFSSQGNISSIHAPGDSDRIIHLNQYQISQQLGQGSYGLVQLAYNLEDSTYYAMKSLSKKKLLKSCGIFNCPPRMKKSYSSTLSQNKKSETNIIDPLTKIYQEIAFHKKLNHPNIVKLIEVLNDHSQEYLYMVFEYVERGPVMQIGRDDPFTEIRAKKYIIQTLLGLEYLHYQKIVHRDIKPANLLLSKDDVIKISDFGVSNEFTGEDIYLSATAGSPAFMAPESVQGGENYFSGKALDLWALGITLYAFLFGKVPFENCNRFLLYQMIINNPVVYPEESPVSVDVMDILTKMLDKNPLSRIKLPQIKIHPWITDKNLNPLPTEAENCGFKSVCVNEEEVANSIRFIPRLETVIKIKMLLKQKSFANPLRFGSVSKLNETNFSTHPPMPLLHRSSCSEINKITENNLIIKAQNQKHQNEYF